MLLDAYGRAITYLRLSVIAECDLCCLYCQAKNRTIPKWQWSVEELELIGRAAAAMGIQHIRLTGGEPLLRADLPRLIERLLRIEGLADLSLTTNGQHLAAQASRLYAAGLRRLNVSLDSLRPDVFAQITGGGCLERTLEGLLKAHALGFAPLKINTVLLRGYNDQEILSLAALAQQKGWHIRFIELMPIGPAAALHSRLFISAEEALRPLRPYLGPALHSGPGPAHVWAYGKGSVGIVSTISAPPCAQCNRLRITATGFLRPCLSSAIEFDLRSIFQTPAPEQALQNIFREAAAYKPASGSHFRGIGMPGTAMCALGG